MQFITCVNSDAGLRKSDLGIFNILWVVFIKGVNAGYWKIFFSVGNILNSIEFSFWFKFIVDPYVPFEIEKIHL